jgi:hypothetical protein
MEYAINLLARNMVTQTPTPAKQVFKYLKGTRDQGDLLHKHNQRGFGKNMLVADTDTSDADCKIM